MQPLGAQVKGILRNATSSDNGPGMAALVKTLTTPVGALYGAVNSKGEILVLEAAGKRNIDDKSETMTTDTIGALYSTTKMITNLAALQLVEKGKLSLDTPIASVLPELKDAQILGADGKLTPAQNPITLRQLMSHTAGFSYSFFNHANVRFRLDNKLEFEGAGTKEAIHGTPLVHEPGTDWQYGANIDFVGEAVARVSGKTLGAYLKENVFEPLGIKDTAFELKDPTRAAAMHQRDESGKLVKGEHLPYYHMTEDQVYHAGGHGLIGTVPDYLKILTVLINNGKGANGAQILSPASAKLMYADQIAHIPGQPLDREIPDALPAFTNKIKLNPGVKKGWSFIGLVTNEDLETGRKAGSAWWAGLCNNYFHVDPVKGVAGFFMSQSFPFNDSAAVSTWITAEKAVYDSLKAK